MSSTTALTTAPSIAATTPSRANVRTWSKNEVEAQPLAELWAQFAANRCRIQRLFILSLQIFGNDKHLICCG